MKHNKELTASAASLLLISVILWGLAFPLLKITLDYVPPIVIGYFRYFIASIPFLIYIFKKEKSSIIYAKLVSNWRSIIGLGVTMVTIPNIAQNIGIQYTTSSIAALITTVAPVFTVILALIILKETKGWEKIVGLIIAISASVTMVIYTGVEIKDASLYGNTLILISSISYGMSGIFGKNALIKSNPIYVTGFSMFFGSIILIPISIIAQEPIDWPLTLSFDGWWYLLILTFLSCIVATFLWYIVLESYEVSKQVLFTYLIPVFAVIFANLLLGEMLSLITIILGIIIIIGITLAEGLLKKKNKNIEKKSTSKPRSR
jgi:drug/metabolite transporter (DMT)-like permease